MPHGPVARHLSVTLALVVGAALAPAAASAAPGAVGPGDRGPEVIAVQEQLDRVGFPTRADGEFGPATAASLRGFEREKGLRADGRLTPAEARVLARQAAREGGRAASVVRPGLPTGEVPGRVAQLTPEGFAIPPAEAPPVVKAIIRSGNEIARAPYRYGGGHGADFVDTGYDCSGSMSYALHGAGLLDEPLVSGAFGSSYGVKGPGEWVTVYGHGGHSYMVVAGLRFDTTARKETGSRWTDEMRSSSGYGVRHPKDL